jgi:hypothetical protein
VTAARAPAAPYAKCTGRRERESNEHDDYHGEKLAAGERRLYRTAQPDAEVVDRRDANDDGDRHESDADVAERREHRYVTREDDRSGCDDSRMHRPEHRPAPEESDDGRVDVVKKHVHAAGPRKARRQFRARQRTEEREYPGEDPCGEDRWDVGKMVRHLGSLHEHRCADDRANDERRGMRETKRSLEVGGHAGRAPATIAKTPNTSDRVARARIGSEVSIPTTK